MSIFEKQRFEIWNQLQHPLKHSLGDFGYSNPALSGVSTLEGALNSLIAVLYPNAKADVADVASLPALGNSLNDYRVVHDDGDGKAAGYRWEQREGEAVASWHKIYDFDWSTDGILAGFIDITQDLYVYKNGKSDLDEDGDVILGLYAGQTVFGGNTAGQNLTLKANSGDGVGAQTGFVQVDDIFRPAVDNMWDLGTVTERFKDGFFSNSILIDTLDLSGGSITDSSGTIDFGATNITTTGTVTGVSVSAGSLIADDGADQVTISPGDYQDTTGAVDFNALNLTTTGTFDASVLTLTETAETLVLDPNVGGTSATIISSLGAIGFGSSNLLTTGTFGAGAGTFTSVAVDNLSLNGNTITTIAGSLILAATTVVDVQSAMTTIGQTVTGTVGVTGSITVDNLSLDGNTISSTNVNGNIILDPNGTGIIQVFSAISPDTDNAYALGTSALRFTDIFISGNIGDGTDSFVIGELLDLRSANFRDFARTSPVQSGDTLFWDAVNGVWLANHPDTEITHNELSGLTTGDAGHTQFALLAGRAGGQTLQGGTGASETLVLESTANVTKGTVQTKDNFVPFTNASFSGTWSGTDLGDATHYFRDLYTKGEARGFRFENFTSGGLPSASAQNIGRTVFATDNNKLYVDTGTAFIVAGVSKFTSDTSWNGSDLTKDVDVSSTITDARLAIWQLRDNANDFEIMFVKIETTSASNVRITTNVALAAGSYRLIGIE